MKGIVIVCLALLGMLAGAVGAYLYIQATDGELQAQVEEVERAAGSGEWGQARARLAAARAQWEQRARVWALLIDHDDMRDIEIGFVDLAAAVAAENGFESQKEAAQLAFYIRHVPESERPGAENVL